MFSGAAATASLRALKRNSRSRLAPHPSKTCSRTVSPGVIRLSWPTSSTRKRGEQRRSPFPSGSLPARTLSKVDFPAPFGPINPRRSLSPIWRFRSANRVRMPKSFEAPTKLIKLTVCWQGVGCLGMQTHSYRPHLQRPPSRIYGVRATPSAGQRSEEKQRTSLY